MATVIAMNAERAAPLGCLLVAIVLVAVAIPHPHEPVRRDSLHSLLPEVPHTVAERHGVTAIALDGDDVYAIAGDMILRVPRDGGAVTTLAAVPGARELVVTSHYVWWAGTLGIERMRKHASEREAVWSRPSYVSRLVAVGDDVWFTEVEASELGWELLHAAPHETFTGWSMNLSTGLYLSRARAPASLDRALAALRTSDVPAFGMHGTGTLGTADELAYPEARHGIALDAFVHRGGRLAIATSDAVELLPQELHCWCIAVRGEPHSGVISWLDGDRRAPVVGGEDPISHLAVDERGFVWVAGDRIGALAELKAF